MVLPVEQRDGERGRFGSIEIRGHRGSPTLSRGPPVWRGSW
jgi:hypothetical protein